MLPHNPMFPRVVWFVFVFKDLGGQQLGYGHMIAHRMIAAEAMKVQKLMCKLSDPRPNAEPLCKFAGPSRLKLETRYTPLLNEHDRTTAWSVSSVPRSQLVTWGLLIGHWGSVYRVRDCNSERVHQQERLQGLKNTRPQATRHLLPPHERCTCSPHPPRQCPRFNSVALHSRTSKELNRSSSRSQAAVVDCLNVLYLNCKEPTPEPRAPKPEARLTDPKNPSGFTFRCGFSSCDVLLHAPLLQCCLSLTWKTPSCARFSPSCRCCALRS